MYDRNITNPTGRLPGDKPLRIRLLGSYGLDNAFGKLVVGMLFRYDTGEVYSHTRTIRRSSLNPALSSQFGSRATQYRDNTRGDGRFPSYKFFDLSLQQEFKAVKFASGRSLNLFAKMDITNLFNHQQKIGFDTTYESLPGGQPLSTGWTKAGTFGSSDGPSYWGEARAVRFSLGLKI
jgi:hypothetical protein